MEQHKEITPIEDKIEFAVLAIEAAARQMGKTPSEIYDRLEKQDLIKHFLIGCYDTLHTQSVQIVGEDVADALYNWEKPLQEGGAL